ncbi:MAG: hypothetical protein ACXWKG_14855, partial [Limisphaerales bacterium]
ELAPLNQNHLLRSTSVIQKIQYDKRAITYSGLDTEATDVLRLNSAPAHITAGGKELRRVETLSKNSYTARKLPKGGFAVQLHRSARDVKVVW